MAFLVLFIVKNRRLHSTANWFVLSLVVADFGVGVAIFPMGHLCSILAVCNNNVYVTLHWFFLHSSVTNLGILTWDRCINIGHSFRYPNSRTSGSPGIVIFISWVIPLIIGLENLTDNRSLDCWHICVCVSFPCCCPHSDCRTGQSKRRFHLPKGSYITRDSWRLQLLFQENCTYLQT